MLNKNSAESEDLRSAGRHREFAMASEEMSEAEFRSFLADKSAFVAPHQCAVGGFCNRRMTSSGAGTRQDLFIASLVREGRHRSGPRTGHARPFTFHRHIGSTRDDFPLQKSCNERVPRKTGYPRDESNPLWEAPRIPGELLKHGIDIGQTSVAKRETHRPKAGKRSFAIMPTASPRWMCSSYRNLISSALRLVDCGAWSTEDFMVWRHRASDRRIDR
jgi:hypothetical protein